MNNHHEWHWMAHFPLKLIAKLRYQSIRCGPCRRDLLLPNAQVLQPPKMSSLVSNSDKYIGNAAEMHQNKILMTRFARNFSGCLASPTATNFPALRLFRDWQLQMKRSLPRKRVHLKYFRGVQTKFKEIKTKCRLLWCLGTKMNDHECVKLDDPECEIIALYII